MSEIALLSIAFLFIALLYSSVGFGGGSSYLALLALAGLQFEMIKTVGLICNIVVVSGSTFVFVRAGHLHLKRAWPFIALSIPFAFLGGMYPITENTFFLLLGSTLVLAALLLWGTITSTRPLFQSTSAGALLGGGIGFLSGLVGIGGGIFLSPILHLSRWGEEKKISAVASFFILVNSISGLTGQLIDPPKLDWYRIAPLCFAVLIGGQVGARLGASKLNPVVIKRVTALVIFLAGANILYKHL